jgi:hypothetical protein
MAKLHRLVVETRAFKSPSDLHEVCVRTAFFLRYFEDQEDKEFAGDTGS